MINLSLSCFRLEGIVQLYEVVSQRWCRLPLRQWKQVRVPLPPVMLLSTHHIDHSYITPLHCAVSVHQAFPYPSELWRPLRGGS